MKLATTSPYKDDSPTFVGSKLKPCDQHYILKDSDGFCLFVVLK